MDPFSQMGSPPEEPRPVLPKLMLKIGFALLATATLCVLVVSIAAAFLQRWGPAVVLLLMGSFSGLFAFSLASTCGKPRGEAVRPGWPPDDIDDDTGDTQAP